MARNLKRFGVFHPKGGELNMGLEFDKFDYEYITSIEVETLVSVFYQTQNDFNPEYAALGKRSTSVGDIINAQGQLYMYKGVGYKRIPKSSELHKKIMETDEAIIEILSRKTLTQEDVNDLMDNCY